MNEGMPINRSPHDKGKLIIQFNVKFPQMIVPEVCPQLETCLPPRNECIIPDDAEEVTLREFDPKAHSRRAGHGGGGSYYDEDDEPRSAGVQCQSH